MAEEWSDLREQVARACRVVGKLGLTKEPSGHVSARVPDSDVVLIKARGEEESGLRFTQPSDIVAVGLDAAPREPLGGLAVPREIYIHTHIYRARPDVTSVVHIHPLAVVLFTICDLPLLPIIGAYDPTTARMALDGIPRYERTVTVSTPALGDEFVATFGQADACLMRSHGITTAGRSVEQATLRAIKLNDLAEINYRARMLGTPRPIPEEDQQVLRRLTGGATAPGQTSTWRYYCQLLGEDGQGGAPSDGSRAAAPTREA